MTDRIYITTDGIRVSKPGFDAKVASVDNLSLYPGMSSMTQVASGTVTVGGGSRTTISFSNPQQRIPYVTLGCSDGTIADRETYCAETRAPYNFVDIRNDVQPGGAPTRSITYSVLIDNWFI